METLKGNVVSYCRVSTRHDEQEDSLENQELLLEKFLKENPCLNQVAMFKDQESGKTTERKGYLNMLERVSRGDISYILSKNNTRLSRSTEISSSLNRVCQKYGTKIIFVSANEVYDPTNRSHVLMNSIKAAVAEDYVYQQSENSKLSHLIKCRDGRLNRQNETYGYRFNTVTNSMEIVEEEAVVIRLMFEMYCYQNMGVSEIGRELAKAGIYGNKSGKSLNANTITKRLKDTAYIGKMAFNKTSSELVTGVGAKSVRKKKPKSEWVYADCPPIISEDLFNLAQKIREERKRTYKKQGSDNEDMDIQGRFSGYHLFATKVFCGECGNTYHHRYGDRNKSVNVYRDSFHKKGHKPGEICCNSDYNQVYEEQLIEITKTAINTFLEKQDEIFDNVFKVISEVIQDQEKNEESSTYRKLLDEKLKEKDRWLSAYKDAVAMDNDMLKAEVMEKYNQVSEEAIALEELIGNASDKEQKNKSITERLTIIQDRIKSMKKIQELTREDILMLVDRIIINKDGTVEVHLLFAESYSYTVQPYKEYKKTLKERESSVFLYELFSLNEIAEMLDVTFENNEQIRSWLYDALTRDEDFHLPTYKMALTIECSNSSQRSHSLFLRNNMVSFFVIVYLIC